MSTYTQILYQIVFGSKDYTFFLTQENCGLLFGYIVRMLEKRDCHPYQVGGFRNHIHIVTHVSTRINLSDLIRDIKRASHEMMVREKKIFSRFKGWQVGYGAFTYHYSLKNVLINYVKNQEKHHGKVSFKVELIQLLKENEVQYDEKYLLV
jgi:putative transposase